MKKILKSALGGSNANRLRAPKLYIRLWKSPPTEAFIIYDESSSPSADDPPEADSNWSESAIPA